MHGVRRNFRIPTRFFYLKPSQVKLLLVMALGLLIQMQVADFLSVRGKQLAVLGNLPHRSLGALYWAHILEPERPDYALDYIAHWVMVDKGEQLLEGQTRPVVPMYALSLGARYGGDKDFEALRKCIMLEHLSKNKLNVDPKR